MAQSSRGRGSSGGRGSNNGGSRSTSSRGRGVRQSTSNRGFAAMDPEEHRELSRRGGEASGGGRKSRGRSSKSR